MENPFFSVVIPTYNRAALLREALDSVFAQEFTDFEVIVVDDGSTDDTASVVRDYGVRIRYLRQENRGPGAARNLGIAQAAGRYVAFLDSDDLWFPWTLGNFRDAIEETHGPSLVAGTGFSFSRTDQLAQVKRDEAVWTCYSDYLATSPNGVWLHVNGTAVRRDCLTGGASFVARDVNGEDNDLWLQLGLAPGFVYIESPLLFGYRRQESSRVSDVTKNIAGAHYLIEQEQAGAYPGGKDRRRDRLNIIGRHLRPHVVASIMEGRIRDAWELYLASFVWNFALARVRFLLGVPVLVCASFLRCKAGGWWLSNRR